MLLKRRPAFFSPTFPSHVTQYACFPPRTNVLIVSKHSIKPYDTRTFATQPSALGGGSAKAVPQKGIAIKDDINKSWKELSVPQKIVRTGTQTTNLVIVVLGIGALVHSPLDTVVDG